MGKTIDTDDLKRELLKRGFYPAIVKGAIEAVPMVETVPTMEAVIRCIECKHRGKETAPGFHRCPYRVFDVRDTDFCSSGERKT